MKKYLKLVVIVLAIGLFCFYTGKAYSQANKLVVEDDGDTRIAVTGTENDTRLVVQGKGNDDSTNALVILDSNENRTILIDDAGKMGVGVVTKNDLDYKFEVDGKIRVGTSIIIKPRDNTPSNPQEGEIWVLKNTP